MVWMVLVLQGKLVRLDRSVILSWVALLERVL